jgi:RNA polymerase sigma factor (sigma-70 family)
VSGTILERVASGDPTAVDECLQQYGGLVWSLTRRSTWNFADAEDAVQEIFIEIWRHAARFDSAIASEATFITMIAQRRLIDRHRKRRRSVNTKPLENESIVTASVESDSIEIREEAERARELMQQLRTKERQILKLSLNDGMSQSEIAESTNMSLGTVKTHARRGLIRLRKLLDADPIAPVRGEAK